MSYVVRAFLAAVVGAATAYVGGVALLIRIGSIPDEDDAWRGSLPAVATQVLPVLSLTVLVALLAVSYLTRNRLRIGVRDLWPPIAIAVTLIAVSTTLAFFAVDDGMPLSDTLLLAAVSTTVMSLLLVVAPALAWRAIITRAPSNKSLDGARGG